MSTSTSIQDILRSFNYYWSGLTLFHQLLIGGTIGTIGVVNIVLLKRLLSQGKKQLTNKVGNDYIVTLPSNKDGETDIRRNIISDKELVTTWDENINTLHESFIKTCEKYGNLPFLGKKSGSTYKFQSYNKIKDLSQYIGSAINTLGISTGDSIGICSVNCEEWMIVEQACNAYSYVTVALYDTFGEEAISHIIGEGEMEIVFCSSQKLSLIEKCIKKCPTLRKVVYFGNVVNEIVLKNINDQNVEISSFFEFRNMGNENLIDPIPPSRDDIATICYTSGTTGLPKGVVLTHGNLVSEIGAILQSGIVDLDENDVHLSYLPLAHMFERIVCGVMISRGARIGFLSGSVKKLAEDAQILKPTVFASVPKLFDRIYRIVNQKILSLSWFKQYLFKVAFAKKKENLKKGILIHKVWDYLIFSEFKQYLGGNVRYMFTGSAPIASEVLDFMRICFSCKVYEAYGQTENSGGCSCSIPNSIDTNNVGIPLPCVEIKLIDAPELNCYTNENPPRGQICVRGPCVSKGYYKLEGKTKETFDEDGWLKTGDIGIFQENGTLKVTDRVKNIFKLSQGEYIAPEKLENILSTSRYVSMIFVYGNSLRSFLVSIVVPDENEIKTWAEENDMEPIFEDIVENETFKQIVLSDLDHVGRELGLNGFEIPKAVSFTNDFSIEDGIVTPTMKLRRIRAKEFFSEEIELMYDSINVIT